MQCDQVTRQQSGFTLVEIMIALTVLSMIMVGTLTAMRTLGDTQEKLGRTTARVDEMRHVSQFLRSSIRQASDGSGGAAAAGGWASVYSRFSDGGSDSLVRAWRDEMIWLAPLNGVEGSSGLHYYRLYRRGNALRVQFLPYDPELQLQDVVWDELGSGYQLVDDLTGFTISYRMQYGMPWLEEVPEVSAQQMPALIKVEILARGRYWPDIVVAPDAWVQ